MEPDTSTGSQPVSGHDPFTFALHAGVVDLKVSVEGPLSSRARDIILRNCQHFLLEQSRADRTIDCRWQFTGDAWQPLLNEALNGFQSGCRLDETTHYMEWCFFRMLFARDRSRGFVTDRFGGMEHAIRCATIYPTMPGEALYFHAATLVYDGRAFLIAGHPGAGKSTISREGRPDSVLSNEISILTLRDGKFWAIQSPFWGTGDVAQRGTPAPVAAICILSQAREVTSWRPIQGAAALAHLMPHVGSQSRLQYEDPRLLSGIAHLLQDVPAFLLDWYRPEHPLSNSPWKP